MKPLLLVQEDADFCRQLAENLRLCGYEVPVVAEADLTADLLDQVDLVVLDVVSRPINSVEALRTIRRYSHLPVVVLACGGLTDCVVALELGADEYLTKPVDESELVARIRALLRRANGRFALPRQENKLLKVGDVEVQLDARNVLRSGTQVPLTPVEFELLRLLLASAGALVSREVMSREVFGRRHAARNRTIDVHISALRRKLGHEQDGRERIRTVRGFGYIYAANGHCLDWEGKSGV